MKAVAARVDVEHHAARATAPACLTSALERT